MAADRRLGCLSIFLFVALCASLFVNFVLMIVAFQRLGGIREAEPIPRFREILLQRGARATTDKIAVITMRGLISTSIPGNVTDSMVDDLRAALQQAREDIVLKPSCWRSIRPAEKSRLPMRSTARLSRRAPGNQLSSTWILWLLRADIMSPAAANF